MQLYNTPGDVELIVGALLSNDFISAELSPQYNMAGIDQTQASLIFGEMQRIIDLDAFGFRHTYTTDYYSNSFYARLVYDDPTTINPIQPDLFNGLSSALLSEVVTKSMVSLIQSNSMVTCISQRPFQRGGFQFITDFTVPFNGFNLPSNPGVFQGQRVNCDITLPQEQALPSYTQRFCLNRPTLCFQPSLPYCV